MFKLIRYVVLISLCWLLSTTTQAQINVELAKSNYLIPAFNTESLPAEEVFIAEDSLLRRFKYIKPVKLSKYELEVRCFYKDNFLIESFRMIILKGTKNKLWVEEIYMPYVYAVTEGTPAIILNDQTRIAIIKDSYRVNKPELVFTQLIHDGLFDQSEKNKQDINTTNYTNNLTENGFQNPDDKVIFEVKLGSRYRSFSYRLRYKPNSADIEISGNGQNIFNIFNQFLNKKTLSRKK